MEIKRISDDELEKVTGGKTTTPQTPQNPQNTQNQQNQQEQCNTKTAPCPVCKVDRVFNLYMGGRAICQTCGKEILL